MNLEKRRELADLSRKQCTLNGKPAHISGISLPVAHVVDETNNLGASWSWEAAERILSKGGKFRT